jgi:8-oxo-dGTP pyrophosphatase MutT (NUDIX family)
MAKKSKTLKNANSTQQTKQKTPPDLKRICGTNEFFTDTLYDSTKIDGKTWNQAFKDCIQAKPIHEAFTILTNYSNLLHKLKGSDLTSKQITVENRLHEVKVRAYLETKYGKKPPKYDFPTHAGTVIVFSDTKALFTQTNDGKYGFPKGKLEFQLSDPTKIETAHPEDSVKAALRELEEEVGLKPSTEDIFLKPTPMDTYVPVYDDVRINQIGTPGYVKVTGYEKKLIPYGKENRWFYFILYVEKGTHDIDLTKLTANAVKEKINAYSYELQQDPKLVFNQYSQKTFPFQKQLVKPKTPPKPKTKSKTPPIKQKTPESWENLAGGKTRKLRRRG